MKRVGTNSASWWWEGGTWEIGHKRIEKQFTNVFIPLKLETKLPAFNSIHTQRHIMVITYVTILSKTGKNWSDLRNLATFFFFFCQNQRVTREKPSIVLELAHSWKSLSQCRAQATCERDPPDLELPNAKGASGQFSAGEQDQFSVYRCSSRHCTARSHSTEVKKRSHSAA